MTGVSTLGQAMAQIDRLKVSQNSFDLLSRQLSSGKKTQKFSGLGIDILTSKRARANFKTLETYQNNMNMADKRIQTMLTSLREFKAQTQNFRDFLVNFSKQSAHQQGDFIRQDDPLTPGIVETTPIGLSSGEMDIDFRTMQNFADSISEFMTELINRQDGERYVFGGANALEQPLGNSSALDTAISTAINNWKNESSPNNISTTQFIADLTDQVASAGNPDAITDTIVGFNATLTAGNAGNVSARINEYNQVDYTSLANNQGFRDVMVAISVIRNESLPPIADVYAEPYTFGDPALEEGAPGATLEEQEDNFFELFGAVTSMVIGALDKIDDEIVKLESARVRIDEAKKVNREQVKIAKDLISGAEDVDLNEVAVQLTSVQTSLDASYRITARMQELSLVNFI
ncbi:MAG: hypothetical protein ACLFR0_03650 [Alphaproteobacteria bacterium]